ncbi:MAG: DUF3810 family protein [Clostridia bacterium]|nr:DUF3810 family protein [Clostridia bacterium]
MSENYENTNNASTAPEVEEATAGEVAAADTETETLLELDELSEQKNKKENPEENMSTGRKVRALLMRPIASSIIKWLFIPFGIAALVIYLIATSSRSMGETFAKSLGMVSNGIAMVFSFIPIPVFEILICALALGLLAYIIYLIVRTIQIKGLFHKLGMWVQFLYTLISLTCVFAILITLSYGIFTYRQPLSKSTDYTNAKVTNKNFSETMLYLIDNVNNSLAEGVANKTIFRTVSGFTRYNTSGRSTQAITAKISQAFDNASKDIPTLKGSKLKSKELLFSPLYSKYQIASVYSPITGEICVNGDYPEVIMPMQIAKTMAKQRGYVDDDDAAFIAYIVCTKYSDDDYIEYAGYFNAYLELSSKFYNENGKTLHLYMSNALIDMAKKEYVQVVKKLDTLYGYSSELQYKPANDELPASQYCDVAKLMLVDFRERVNNGSIKIDSTEVKSYGKFCNYLVNDYLLDTYFQDDVRDVYKEYHPTLN